MPEPAPAPQPGAQPQPEPEPQPEPPQPEPEEPAEEPPKPRPAGREEKQQAGGLPRNLKLMRGMTFCLAFGEMLTRQTTEQMWLMRFDGAQPPNPTVCHPAVPPATPAPLATGVRDWEGREGAVAYC